MMQQQPEELPNFSPSFSSYSSETLAEIAARVINELRLDPLQNDTDINDNDDDPRFQPWEEDQNDHFTSQNDNNENENDDDDDDDFSFALVSRDAETSPVSADDIFYNGQIKPMYNIMYPLFNYKNNAPLNDAVSSGSIYNNSVSNSGQNETIRRRLPLRKLMFEERETASCSSSEESVDLEGVPEDTYCVWNANAVARDRKKSKSTGSGSDSGSPSKRWKLRELLLRSLSEGKGKKNSDSNNNCSDGDNKKRGFVFGVPGKRTNKVAAAKNGSGDCYSGASEARDGKNGKKSVLPYRQEFVGIFANVNGLGRNLHPF